MTERTTITTKNGTVLNGTKVAPKVTAVGAAGVLLTGGLVDIDSRGSSTRIRTDDGKYHEGRKI